MTRTLTDMAKKAATADTDQQPSINVRIPADLHQTAKMVAARRGMTLGDYVAQIVRPVAEADWASIVDEDRRTKR